MGGLYEKLILILPPGGRRRRCLSARAATGCRARASQKPCGAGGAGSVKQVLKTKSDRNECIGTKYQNSKHSGECGLTQTHMHGLSGKSPLCMCTIRGGNVALGHEKDDQEPSGANKPPFWGGGSSKCLRQITCT